MLSTEGRGTVALEGPATLEGLDVCCAPDMPTRWVTTAAADETEVVIRAEWGSRRVRCCRCDAGFDAAGPTAFADDRPLCDACVFEFDAQLAMVLAAVSVLRAFGSGQPTEGEAQVALDLLAFSRLYETFAAKHGPRREPQLPTPSA